MPGPEETRDKNGNELGSRLVFQFDWQSDCCRFADEDAYGRTREVSFGFLGPSTVGWLFAFGWIGNYSHVVVLADEGEKGWHIHLGIAW